MNLSSSSRISTCWVMSELAMLLPPTMISNGMCRTFFARPSTVRGNVAENNAWFAREVTHQSSVK